jgi:hypothetical protein
MFSFIFVIQVLLLTPGIQTGEVIGYIPQLTPSQTAPSNKELTNLPAKSIPKPQKANDESGGERATEEAQSADDVGGVEHATAEAQSVDDVGGEHATEEVRSVDDVSGHKVGEKDGEKISTINEEEVFEPKTASSLVENFFTILEILKNLGVVTPQKIFDFYNNKQHTPRARTKLTFNQNGESFTIPLSFVKNNFIIAHYNTTDLSMLSDFEEIKKKLSIVNKSFVSLGKPLKFAHTNVYVRDTIIYCNKTNGKQDRSIPTVKPLPPLPLASQPPRTRLTVDSL